MRITANLENPKLSVRIMHAQPPENPVGISQLFSYQFQIDHIEKVKNKDFCFFCGYNFPILGEFEITIFGIIDCKSISNMINLLIQPSLFLPLVTKAPIC
jgi:hypothetical protein